MKLSFDQNLSPRLAALLADLYAGSDHVFHLGLDQATDQVVWEYARDHSFLIVSKDSDFSDLCTLHGFPPKVIWLRIGNCTTSQIESLLRSHYDDVVQLNNDSSAGVLSLF